MRKIKFISTLSVSFPVLFLWFSISCRSSDADNKTIDGGSVAINVKLAQDDYEDAANRNVQASVNKTLGYSNDLIQRREVPFGGDFDLVAELKPEASSLKGTAQASVNPVAAATPITRAIKFRVVVYNASGQYDSSYIYSVATGGAVTPDSGAAMKLNGGQNYTFIAYSYNANVAPNEDLTGTNLSTATIQVSGQYFMYYKVNMTPSGNTGAQNNLNVVLKHSFSTITVNVDASLTNGYNITNITGVTLGKAYPSATIALNSGNVTSTGTAGTVAVLFPGGSLSSSNITATSAVIVNNATNTNDGSFNIGTLTVGPLTGSNITFDKLTIQPGVRYNLTMKLTPKDRFFDDTTSGTTLKVAQINGKVWMRYNLGADTSVNPDLPNPSNAALFGNYYQWGRSKVVATGFTNPGAINPWDANSTPSGSSWNSGTETAPVRTGNDPCPTNFRVPTIAEFQDLIDSTIQTNTNDSSWDNGSATNYGSIKVFTSKRDKNVILSFPATGYRNSFDGSLVTIPAPRGTIGIYWASSLPNGATYRNMQLYNNSVDLSIGAVGPNFGENVRCIRVN